MAAMSDELRAVLAEAQALHRWRGDFLGCGCGWNWPEVRTFFCGEDERIAKAHAAHVADALLSLPGVAVIQLPEPGEGTWKLIRRSTYGLVCVTCGVAYGGWRRVPHEAERDRVRAERYGCSTCKNRKTVAALPEHHAHHEHNPDWPYVSGGYCCAATQMKAIGPNDCAKCGEPYPCAAAVLAAGEEHHG
ncbi:hypothetical protein SEA_FLYPOTENUSE_41 [Mycobacterium phage Flypotenuse]|nr:hypothetical protein SEA_GLEXAN_44 [Mycobacterium phage Glexan]QDH91918.1 hypothetical protein SEA_FLYPOTENUSE_41 [Mycobacterium phage Flypotenuse]